MKLLCSASYPEWFLFLNFLFCFLFLFYFSPVVFVWFYAVNQTLKTTEIYSDLLSLVSSFIKGHITGSDVSCLFS